MTDDIGSMISRGNIRLKEPMRLFDSHKMVLVREYGR